ncbi:hypothetical protein Hanom_Chr03g00260951 [Helianthus anomalus]
MCSNNMASTSTYNTLFFCKSFIILLDDDDECLFLLFTKSIKTLNGFSSNTNGSTKNFFFSFPTTTVIRS